MIVELPDDQIEAVLGAMRAIALAHGPGEASDEDRATIIAAGRIMLGREAVEPEAIEPVGPDQLAGAMLSGDDARMACRMIAVMSLVDGRLDDGKIELVQEFAAALEVDEEYVQVLAEAAADEISAAAACMVRKNAESFPELDTSKLDESAVAPFLPYGDGNDDRGLEARYLELEGSAPGSFGRAFYDHFQKNDFRFPGNPEALAEGFTTPHDSSHVLSSYSTSEQGELCVSTFIGAMHPDHPMAAEVLPVIFSWHLGIKLNEIAKSHTGAFDPRRFWTAWDRGAATTVDVVDEGWDFWAATETPLDELRADYGVTPVEDELLA